MQLQKRTLLGVGITISPKEEILACIKSFFSTSKPATRNLLTIVTPNPEQIMLAGKDADFQAILNHADIALPDGAGVVWALKKVSSFKSQVSRLERISGVDFMEELCALASKNKWSVAFIGGRDGVAGEALSALQKKYVGLKGFADSGPTLEIQNLKIKSQNNFLETLGKKLEEENVRFVFVGMGAPKQEYFINQLVTCHLELATPSTPMVLMSVGGSFDIFAGKIKRAPKSVQQIGFEWLWRLFQEPWRIKRQVVLVPFFLRCIFQKKW